LECQCHSEFGHNTLRKEIYVVITVFCSAFDGAGVMEVVDGGCDDGACDDGGYGDGDNGLISVICW
jgi:hypothetical protein